MGLAILEGGTYFSRHLEYPDFWTRFEIDISRIQCWTIRVGVSLGEKRLVVPAVRFPQVMISISSLHHLYSAGSGVRLHRLLFSFSVPSLDRRRFNTFDSALKNLLRFAV